MTTQSLTNNAAAARLTEFLNIFFSAPNDVSKYPQVVLALREKVTPDDDLIVLPRFHETTDEAYVYIVARRTVSARQAQDLIEAFAGPSYALAGDRLPYDLDLADPIENAIAEFAQDASVTTFRISSSSNTAMRQALRSALETMRDVTKKAPTRGWIPNKPLGRLITDFSAALAAGGSGTSEAILQQIINRGGINATNLAHLRIKRLHRLGLSRDLLAMSDLPHVLVQDPPRPVKEAVLDAAYAIAVADPLNKNDIETAIKQLSDITVRLPVHESTSHYDTAAVSVLLTAAIGRKDTARLANLLSEVEAQARSAALPEALLTAARSLISHEVPAPVASPVISQKLTTWLDLFITDSARTVAKIRENEEWREWAPLSDFDGMLSEHLVKLDDTEWADAWSRIGIIVEALDFQSSVPRTSREFINYALTSNKFSNGDLLTLSALTDAFLRTGPSQATYHALLQELLDTTPQWVSTERAEVVLDFADMLVRMPCPDESSRLNLGHGLLVPLHRHRTRLDAATFSFAEQLSKELDLHLAWTSQEPEEPAEQKDFARRTVLLYSLDKSVLQRVSAELHRQFPTLRIHVSHDRDGSPTLKQKARASDVVALAVRCAKHAATGFIREYAKDKDAVFCANGSGSASLLSAAVRGLTGGHRSH